jgi:hypothetical protein
MRLLHRPRGGKHIVCAGNDESDQKGEQIEHLSIALAVEVFAVRQA